MGSNEMPRFVVFQRPPKAVATYQVFESLGSMAMSAIRPVTKPGPRVRNSMAASRSSMEEPDPAVSWPDTGWVESKVARIRGTEKSGCLMVVLQKSLVLSSPGILGPMERWGNDGAQAIA